jgi:hypothetical protein
VFEKDRRVCATHPPRDQLWAGGTTQPGLLLTVVVLSAGMQDRDGAKPVLLDTYLRTPVRFFFADGGFAGRLLDWARAILATTLHIVRKPAGQRGFAVIPRRWAVERTVISSNTLLQGFVTLQLHQQYLARNINGCRCHSTTGVPHPTS